jgi:hypothetical protein
MVNVTASMVNVTASMVNVTASIFHVTASIFHVTNLTPGSECNPRAGSASSEQLNIMASKYSTLMTTVLDHNKRRGAVQSCIHSSTDIPVRLLHHPPRSQRARRVFIYLVESS